MYKESTKECSPKAGNTQKTGLRPNDPLLPSKKQKTAQTKQFKTLNGKPPIVIGHRGASGHLPAHTLESYKLAIEHGADVIEPDLVLTKDGVLICRHEPMLSISTNVEKFPEFAERKKWKGVSGESHHDWFVDDFTLEEIKKLRATQAFSHRPQEHNEKFPIATFDEIIHLAKTESAKLGRTIFIYPELKHPIYHHNNDLRIADALLATLDREGWNHQDSPVYVQCTEVSTLKYIHSKSTVKLIQLILASGIDNEGELLMHDSDGKPYDFNFTKDSRTFQDLVTDKGLDFIKTYAVGVGVWTPYIIPHSHKDLDSDGEPDDLNEDGLIDHRDRVKMPATDLIERAHKKGLIVHAWTLKDEVSNLLSDYDGDPKKEYEELFELGIDGVFTDFPDTAIEARTEFFGELLGNL